MHEQKGQVRRYARLKNAKPYFIGEIHFQKGGDIGI